MSPEAANEIPTITQRFVNRHLWFFCSTFWVFAVLSSAIGRFQKSHYDIFLVFLGYLAWTIPWWIGNLLVMPLLIATGCYVTQKWHNNGLRVCLYFGAVLLAEALHISMGVYSAYLLDMTLPTLEPRVIDSVIKAYHYYNEHNLWYMDLQMFILYILLGIAWQWQESASNAKLAGEKLVRQLAQAELAAFRAQLNPHFLFNTLNGISALVRTERKSNALKALNELSLLLRGIIEGRALDFSELGRELNLVENYIELQTLRFGKKLQYTQRVSPEAMGFRVPGMLLLPLIENAIEHGSKGDLHIILTALLGKDRLTITIHNPVDANAGSTGFGIGLGNNVARLKLLYGDNFQFNQMLENRNFKVEIHLPRH